MWAGIVQGTGEAAPEVGGLLLVVLLVWLALRACQAYDRAAARRRRAAIAARRSLEDTPLWATTPEHAVFRDGQLVSVRWPGRVYVSSQVAQLDRMMVRQRRAGVR